MAFTGSTEVGQQIMQYATQNIIPVTLELGGKSPNIFFADVMDEEDAFFDKALEGFALFAFNQAKSAPVRAARWCRNPFMSALWSGRSGAWSRFAAVIRWITLPRWGRRYRMASWKPSSTILISVKRGADVLTGGRRKVLGGDLQEGYYLEPTILFGKNNMRVFQRKFWTGAGRHHV